MLEQNRYEDNRNIYIMDYNLLFFRVPKVAITSICQITANLLGHELSKSKLRQFMLPSIASTELQKYPELYKVAFVRNPWDRLLSCYLQKTSMGRTGFFKRNKLDPKMTFEEFAYAVCDIPDYKADRHFRSQFTYIFNHEAALLPDYIGSFSSFDQDISKVLAEVNAPLQEIPHYNKTSHSHYTDYYSQALMEAVELRYKLDIDIFGFQYGRTLGEEFYTSWQ